jgi:hypothetical protein
MNSPSLSVDSVGKTMRRLLDRPNRRLAMLDRATGKEVGVSPDLAASASGFLPVFLVAGDAVWRDATGKSFGIQLVRDPSGMLGYRSHGIDTGPFSAVMLSMMEAVEQTARPGVLLMNDFDKLWREIEAGLGEAAGLHARTGPSPSATR